MASYDDYDVENDRDADEDYTHETSDDVRLCTKLLKDAYELKNFNIIDDIISDMVMKSNIDGLTKLHSASGYGFDELVEKYLKVEKIDPNSECVFNELTSITPLHFAAGIGPDAIAPNRARCIELLLRHGANINKCTSRLDTPLHWASKISNREIAETLLKHGADLSTLNLDSCTCAHGAAFYKNLDTLELLIERNVDVNTSDCSGKTILHLLCKDSLEPTNAISEYTSYSNPASLAGGKYSRAGKAAGMSSKLIDIICNLIVRFKMNVNSKDSVGFTPLMYACEYGNIELIKLLIGYGADVNVCSDEGITCMLLAIVNAEVRVVKELLESGFKLNDKKIQASYLTDAAYLNDIEIVNVLIEAGVEVNETKEDENGAILNPLWAACERSNVEIAKRLLECGANVVIREDLKMTALHCVAMAQCECVAIAKLLVKHKCDLNVRTAQAGETPLFLACNSGYAEIVEFLLQSGVNPNEASAAHRTCFQQATFRGYKNIIMILLSYNYKLTEDDLIDMNLLIMDLVQDNDKEMLRYLLDRKLVKYETILKCIKELPKIEGDDETASAAVRKENTSANLNITTIEELMKFLNIKK